MTGSTKQSILPRTRRMNCFVTVLLAMTTDARLPSFRGDAKHRTRNLEIPRCAIAHLRSGPSDHPGMTESGSPQRRQVHMRLRASRRDAPELCIYFPPKEGVGNAGCPMHPRPRVQL